MDFMEMIKMLMNIYLMTLIVSFNFISISYGTPNNNDEFVWPTRGVVSSYFEMRFGSMHEGIDIICPKHREIYAAKDGIVIRSKKNRRLGNHVVVDHQDGYKTVYGHGEELLVARGDEVKQGDPLITCGSTGISTGNHLHLEVIKNNKRIDPMKVFSGHP